MHADAECQWHCAHTHPGIFLIRQTAAASAHKNIVMMINRRQTRRITIGTYMRVCLLSTHTHCRLAVHFYFEYVDKWQFMHPPPSNATDIGPSICLPVCRAYNRCILTQLLKPFFILLGHVISGACIRDSQSLDILTGMVEAKTCAVWQTRPLSLFLRFSLIDRSTAAAMRTQ